ncbi:MAG TPA: glycoside hydrolase family 43 protein [Mobilitalea sp.]|nr:glycoside hydrolase family 43 protein [Mobilitalea sp.]
MKQAYLFVHFKEKHTPDGEQVYFALSRDGFHWDKCNDGNPVLESTMGDEGVRDFTITRTKEGKFYIIATDLGLAKHFNGKYKGTWDEIGTNGSKDLVLWESEDLMHWSEQRMIHLGDESFGCLWAPDIIYDNKSQDYVIHWSSSHRDNNYGPKKIYYSRTKDFEHFTKAEILYEKEDSGIIDSAMYEKDGIYYLFIKSEANPAMIILLKSDTVTGPFTRIYDFDEEMTKLAQGMYEAPTAFQAEDGRWCLFLDFYGTTKDKQGYVPFVSQDISTGKFARSDEAFSFPYGFKHGTILTITPEEYERLKNFYD